jgi:hypothetical protein
VSVSILNLASIPAALGQLILKFAVAKYIEAAGSTPGAMTERASSIKAIATAIDGVALGTTSVGVLVSQTAADLAKNNVSVSSQLLINGLTELVTAALPVSGGLLSAVNGALANVFLQDVIAVATSFGA